VISVTALTADVSCAATGPDLRGASAARTTRADRSGSVDEDRSAAVTSSRTAVRSWPLLVLAVPAAAEVWSGWVGIARLTGFGMVSPLPGIWPSLHLDTSITLPVGWRHTRPTRYGPGWPASTRSAHGHAGSRSGRRCCPSY
jgi:hypothetical protein